MKSRTGIFFVYKCMNIYIESSCVCASIQKGRLRMDVRFRNASATLAIKRQFVVQIITNASDVRLFFFRRSRISDCALISAVRLIRDDAFSGISERFITKKVPLGPMAGRCHGRSFFFCSRVLSCVVTYSFDPQFRSAKRISGEGWWK